MAAGSKSPSVELRVPGPDGERVVRVSNPDRVYFPELGLTKVGVAEYYLAVADGIVRQLFERPCMMHRFPDGVAGERVYQKRLPKGAPDWVQTAHVKFPSGRSADELCVTEPASVVWAVQMSTVEFHPWHSRRADTERPDELRIDLDPQPGTDYRDARAVALTVREVLADAGLVGFPKTSGNRGMHIYVRIEPRWGFTQVRRAALAFARELERRLPDLVTSKWWKEERGPRVFADYNQNARDRTIASAYSIRAFPTAPVSAPLTWDEVPDAEPQDFTVRTMPERFARLGDVWAGIDDTVHSIDLLLEWAERDESDRGLEDAPYPPHFPKMEGEPMRVAPSRARPREDG
jgi:DNA ligase D